jgi:callose synthase
LDLSLNFPGFHRWKFTDVLRNVLKVIVSLLWVIVLQIFYVHSFDGAPEFIRKLLSFVHQMKGIPPYYVLAVAVYLIPNILAALLFLFPMLRRWIENSDWHIFRLLLWWQQVLSAYDMLPIQCTYLHRESNAYFHLIIKISETEAIFINFT